MNIQTAINCVFKVILTLAIIIVAVNLCSFLIAAETDLKTNTQYTEQVIKSYK